MLISNSMPVGIYGKKYVEIWNCLAYNTFIILLSVEGYSNNGNYARKTKFYVLYTSAISLSRISRILFTAELPL